MMFALSPGKVAERAKGDCGNKSTEKKEVISF